MDLERLTIDRAPRARAGGPAPARRPRRRGLGWLVVLAVLAGLGWLFRRPLGAAIDRVTLPAVAVQRVQRSSPLAASSVAGTAANGYVVARRRAALSADTPGRIVEMNVEEGSTVRAGDVVARLYDEEYAAALRRAEADLAAARTSRARAGAQAASARARLEELRSVERSSLAQRDEAGAALELERSSSRRVRALVADGVLSDEELDRAEAALAEARARLEAAEAEVARSRAALATGEAEVAVADAEVAEAEARLAVLSAERDQARATLEKTLVRAPFDGVVVLKDAEVGEVVSPNAVGSQSRGSVATLVDLASLEAQVEVPETSIAAVALDTPAAIYLDAWPSKRYDGTVARIWPTANRQKATVEVRVTFDAPDADLRPEMGARVVFQPRERAPAEEEQAFADAILVPEEALVRVDGEHAVFVVERDVARLRPVVTGAARGGRVVVREGLVEGETIVSRPPGTLADGDRVRVP